MDNLPPQGMSNAVVSSPDSSAPHAPELVVLLDEAGHATGSAPKRSVHGARTPLHLGFSAAIRAG